MVMGKRQDNVMSTDVKEKKQTTIHFGNDVRKTESVHEQTNHHHVQFASETIVIPRYNTENDSDDDHDDGRNSFDADSDLSSSFRRRAYSDCHKTKAALTSKIVKRKTKATQICSPVSTNNVEKCQKRNTTVSYEQFSKDMAVSEKIVVTINESETTSDLNDVGYSRPRSFSESSKFEKPLKSILKYSRPEATCVVVVHKD